MKTIAYYRVSTQKQGASGLGLEAQKAAVETSFQPLKSFTEVESGKNSDRPELAKAISACKRLGATLVIAKLDRLSRNVYFISGLMEAGIDFVACDNPNANRLTVHILAAIAEDEARRISERTKAALAALKRRGVALGSSREGHWEGREDRRKAGATTANLRSTVVRMTRSREYHAYFTPKVSAMRIAGCSLSEIAATLNTDGYTTPRGSQFTKSTISKLLKESV
jgi:DNA invertase Pin-like site-specific DNA recombinase